MYDRHTDLEARIEAALAVIDTNVRGLHTEAAWKNIYLTKLDTVRKILEGKDKA